MMQTSLGKQYSANIKTRLSAFRIGGVLLADIIVLLLFSILTDFKIVSLSNVFRLLRQAAQLGIMAQGIAILMIAGEFDLSSEAYVALAPILAMTFADIFGGQLMIGIVCALICVSFLGVINGLLVTRTRLPSFIATLGTMWIYKGISLILTYGSVRSIPDTTFGFIISGNLHGFPMSALWLILISVLFSYIMHRTQFGNWIFATGGNVNAAITVGINVQRVKILCYVIVAVASSITGFMVDFYLGSLNPLVGEGYTMESMAAAVIGGVALSGGVGSMGGVMLGAALIAIINSGLVLLGVNAYWQQLAVGIVMIVTVILNRRMTKSV